MITAPMINHGQIELPQIGKSLATPAAPMEVIIKADGSLTLRDRAKSSVEQKVDRNQLIEAIKQASTEYGTAGGNCGRQKCTLRRSDQSDGHSAAKSSAESGFAGATNE